MVRKCVIGICFVVFVLTGCPFRHSDPELLKQKLQVYKVPPSGISQVGAFTRFSPPALSDWHRKREINTYF